MYACITKANYLVWNTELEQAKEYMADKSHIPRMALELATIPAFVSAACGDENMRKFAFDKLGGLESTLQRYKRSEDISKMIDEISKWNAEITVEDLERFDSAEKTSENYCKLEELTRDQQMFNYELDLKLVDAESHLLRSLLQFMDGSYIRGFYNFRSCFMKYKEIYHKIEQFKNEPKTSNNFIHSDVIYPTYFGVGLVSVLPPDLLAILSHIGFNIDRDLGFELMKKAQQYGGRILGKATFMLCLKYLFIPTPFQKPKINLDLAEPILQKVGNLYPKSGFFKFVIAYHNVKNGQVNKAIENISQSIEVLTQASGETPISMIYVLGLAQFYAGNLEQAEELSTQVANHEKGKFDATGNSIILLAACKLKKGDKQAANQLIDSLAKKVSKQNKFPHEKVETLKHIKNEQDRHLFIILSLFQNIYWNRDLLHMSEELITPLYEFFKQFVLDVKVVDEKSKVYPDICSGIHFVNAHFLQVLNKAEESLQEFHKTTSFEKIKIEKIWSAFSYYELAEFTYFNKVVAGVENSQEEKLKYLHETKSLLEKCQKISGFTFDDIIHARAKLAIKLVDKEVKEIKK
ncbi:hypothetical protein NAEGRDRAFT_78228 [Naegleria gruberi]|uniref:Uncharacterized protein n=1 Tax=Naegleria gruberi TaxID=5762 RepID=D2V1C5_NAEGR|nr:uncharacterized protein NAEGRDRAFT_78228 [Naegleria gruberi]EFC49446.1 hypothetical protein NAEGRDRAFT_78228 [Naegleria gruberi]|eukprot:XP_002682190.1 hypothetical protein NAEGRDRAFT_78228 [Naegleria gruberi strain NEG-M]